MAPTSRGALLNLHYYYYYYCYYYYCMIYFIKRVLYKYGITLKKILTSQNWLSYNNLTRLNKEKLFVMCFGKVT